MKGPTPDDVVFHLTFQAEILDQVARIAATPDRQDKARAKAAELRAQIVRTQVGRTDQDLDLAV